MSRFITETLKWDFYFYLKGGSILFGLL